MNDAFDNFAANLSESERTAALAAWQACQARYTPVVAELQVNLQDALPYVRQVLKENTKPEPSADLWRLIIDSEEALEEASYFMKEQLAAFYRQYINEFLTVEKLGAVYGS